MGRVDIPGPAVAAPDVRAWWYSHDVTNDQRRHIIHTLVAVGVNADGQREVLGLDVASDGDGADWLGLELLAKARTIMIDTDQPDPTPIAA